MIDVESVCRDIGASAERILRVFRAFLTLDTSTFAREAVDGSLADRWKLSARLVAIVCVATFALVVIIGAFSQLNFLKLSRTALSAVIGSLILAAPLYLLLKWACRGNFLHFLINIVAIKHAVYIVVWAIAWLILMLAEPTRTDFTLLLDGVGQRTVAYQKICGDVARRAERLSITTNMAQRSAQIVEDMRVVADWSQRDIRPETKLAELQLFLARTEASEAALYRDATRVAVLVAEGLEADRNFADRYPLAWVSGWVLAIGAALVGAWAWVHIWKAAVWPARGWRGKGRAVLAVGLGWAASGAMLIGWVWSSGLLPQTELPSLLGIEHMNSEEINHTLSALEVYGSQLSSRVALDESKLRRRYRSLEPICPDVPSYGLWRQNS